MSLLHSVWSQQNAMQSAETTAQLVLPVTFPDTCCCWTLTPAAELLYYFSCCLKGSKFKQLVSAKSQMGWIESTDWRLPLCWSVCWEWMAVRMWEVAITNCTVRPPSAVFIGLLVVWMVKLSFVLYDWLHPWRQSLFNSTSSDLSFCLVCTFTAQYSWVYLTRSFKTVRIPCLLPHLPSDISY